MKGIVLAGGSGTRLHPVTRVISKQLLPVYDKPMVYYPLSLLMQAGIREVLVISDAARPAGLSRAARRRQPVRDGFDYCEQPRPEGLAQAFPPRPRLSGWPAACLVLGDNILHGHGLTEMLTGCAD